MGLGPRENVLDLEEDPDLGADPGYFFLSFVTGRQDLFGGDFFVNFF